MTIWLDIAVPALIVVVLESAFHGSLPVGSDDANARVDAGIGEHDIEAAVAAHRLIKGALDCRSVGHIDLRAIHFQAQCSEPAALAFESTRTGTGDSQREFAKRIGRTTNFVWRIEAGERKVDVLEYIEIARAADIEPDELMRWVMR